MVECPVCYHTFATEFALQGHIRLKRDSEHMTFKRRQSEKPSQEIIKTSIVQPTGNSIRAVLENLLREKEGQQIQDANDDKFLQKLEDLLSKERETDENEAEKNYNQGWHDRDKQSQKEINENSIKIKNETNQQCQERINAACDKIRNEAAEQCQHSIDSALKQDLDERSFYLWCGDCNYGKLILPGSAYYKYLTDLLRWLGVICPECSRKRGLSPHFHSISYIDMSDGIAKLEMDLRYRDEEERRRYEREIKDMKTKLKQ